MSPDRSDHVPVLADELVGALDPRPGATVIDCTFGAGGHARRVAERIGPEGLLICVDRDPRSERIHAEIAASIEPQTRFLRDSFASALATLDDEGLRADHVYMDFGISSLQLDDAERGFSYSHEAPLDMRMDPDAELSAHELVNSWPEARIAEALRGYGEEPRARRIAREIVRNRPLETTTELVEAVRAAVPTSVLFGRGHPARRTFQAIRIAVNSELEQIEAALPAAWGLLALGGTFAAISFHSLEDRRVKRFLVDRARGCICPPELPECRCGHEPEAELLTRKPLRPSETEVGENPRARSARLRVARKLAEASEGIG